MLSGVYFSYLVFIFSFFFISFYRYHYMVFLLGIEFLMLSLYYLMSDLFFFMFGGFDFLIIFLVMVVVEGAFGLSLLVYFGFSSGGDYFGSFNRF